MYLRRSALGACLILTCLFGAIANADPLPPKWQKHRDKTNPLATNACKGDKAAFKKLVSLHDSGNAVATYNLAWMMYPGNDCPIIEQHKSKARRYEFVLQAALKGYPIAQQTLAEFYLGTEGYPVDREKAGHWMEKAILGGYGEAAMIMAERYAFGTDGFKVDATAASRLYEYAQHEGVSGKRMKKIKQRILALYNSEEDDLYEDPSMDAEALANMLKGTGNLKPADRSIIGPNDSLDRPFTE